MEHIKISVFYLLVNLQHVSVLGPTIRELIIRWWKETVEY